jgi:hypothetical protein
MPPSTPANTSRVVFSWRENRALRYHVRQLEQSLDRATTILLQSERDQVDACEELLHIREDLCTLTAS